MESGSKMSKKYKYYLFRRSYNGSRIAVYCNRNGDIKYTINHIDINKNRIYNRQRNKKIREMMKDKDLVEAIKYAILYNNTDKIDKKYHCLIPTIKYNLEWEKCEYD